MDSASLLQGKKKFTAFLAAAFMMYGPIKKLSRVNASIQQAIAAADPVLLQQALLMAGRAEVEVDGSPVTIEPDE